MRFKNYLIERSSSYGAGITFVDIDETLAYTKAKIIVKNKITGNITIELSNAEFNSYSLKDDEEYDFSQFRDSKLFKSTSQPIQPVIDRIKRMVTMLKQNDRDSQIIFLTARADFDNKNVFLSWFKEQGIDMNFKNLYVERSGNMKTGTIPEKKRKTIMKYLQKGIYRRVRMLDDHLGNIKEFLTIPQYIGSKLINDMCISFNIPENEAVMEFYGLLVDDKGGLKLIDKKDIKNTK